MYGGQQMPCFRYLKVKSGTLLHKFSFADVVKQLLRILTLVVNKTDTLVMSTAMVEKYREVD